jgi:hypothetical protein
MVGGPRQVHVTALRDNRRQGEVPMMVQTKVFRSSVSSWAKLFQEAATFASEIGSDRLITISHSADQGEGVVVVWYWGDE